MSSLSNLRSRRAVGVPEARAMLTVPLLAVAADARIEPAEMACVLKLCGENPILRRLGTAVLAQLGKAIMEDMSVRGPGALFAETVENLPPPLRETALCFALRVCIAEGGLDRDLREALGLMADSLGIAPQRFGLFEEVLLTLDRSDTG